MEIHELRPLRKFSVKYIGPTSFRQSKIKITEAKRFRDGKPMSITQSYSCEVGNIHQQALNILIELGFNPVARSSEYNTDYILCDNWDQDFKDLKWS
tara:strand:+ start:679 stop:969 length:291 start_codon:yes stop_codon:yes gene_type:complete